MFPRERSMAGITMMGSDSSKAVEGESPTTGIDIGWGGGGGGGGGTRARWTRAFEVVVVVVGGRGCPSEPAMSVLWVNSKARSW